MTGEVIPFGLPGGRAVAGRVGEVRGVAVEVWRECRPGGGMRVVLTPTRKGFSTVALFPPDSYPIAERLAYVVLLALQAADETWTGAQP